METGQLITAYLVSAVVAGLIATIVALAKRRHPGYWMLACFLFPPLIFLLLILPKGKNVHNPQRDPFGGKRMRTRTLKLFRSSHLCSSLAVSMMIGMRRTSQPYVDAMGRAARLWHLRRYSTPTDGAPPCCSRLTHADLSSPWIRIAH